MAHDIFISYAMEDKPIADAACAALESEGIRCWIAPRDVLPGRDWGEAIISAIKASKAMVLIFSSNANNSPQIKREVNHAIETGLSVITFRIENVDPTGALEFYLDVVHWLDAIDPPLEKQLQRLSEIVKQILGAPAPSRPTLIKSVPYSKWWVWVGAGLLAAVLIIVAWVYTNRNGSPVVVNPTTTPTPGAVTSPAGQLTSVVNVNSNGIPGSAVTNSTTQSPLSTNSQTEVPDDTDKRIGDAVKVLGDPNSNELERVTAISTLEPLAKTSIDRHRIMVRALTTFIRSKAAWREGTNRPDKPAPEDIQAAITALGRRKWVYTNGENERIDFTNLDLRGVVFRIEGIRANFNGIRLRGAHLDEAILKDADFRCANLSGAFMKEVDVDKTDFDGADLSNLKNTNEARMGVAWNRGNAHCAH